MLRPVPRCHRFISALLALLVLATSVGLTAERHRCRISGRSTEALALPGLVKHTPQPGKACGKRRMAGCCDVSKVLRKLEAKSQTGKATTLPAPHWLPAALPAPVWAGLATPARATGVAVGTAANSSPPGVPRAGRVLLAHLSTLIV